MEESNDEEFYPTSSDEKSSMRAADLDRPWLTSTVER